MNDKNFKLKKVEFFKKEKTRYWSRFSFSDLVKAEAEFRADLYEEVLVNELKNLDGSTWHLEVFACDDKGTMITE